MDNPAMNGRDVEDVELAERLEAYADARLSPSLLATSRMRAHVVSAAHRHAAVARLDGDRATDRAAGDPAKLATRPRLLRVPRWRRPVAALLAAGLAVALAVGSVAAARPGGPLYATRVWAESLILPATASDRASAEVRRLDDRLGEAADAIAAGDPGAAAAALDAYNGILSEATTGANGNGSANAALDTAVRRNIQVLNALLGRDSFPDQARDAIEHAIEQSDSAANGLQGQPGVGAPPSTSPGNGAAPSIKPEHTKTPDKATPRPTPKPHRTPEPHPTPAAAH
jgi:hypothetical protein